MAVQYAVCANRLQHATKDHVQLTALSAPTVRGHDVQRLVVEVYKVALVLSYRMLSIRAQFARSCTRHDHATQMIALLMLRCMCGVRGRHARSLVATALSRVRVRARLRAMVGKSARH